MWASEMLLYGFLNNQNFRARVRLLFNISNVSLLIWLPKTFTFEYLILSFHTNSLVRKRKKTNEKNKSKIG